MEFSPDGSLFASATVGGSLQVWNSETQQKVQVLSDHGEEVVALAFQPDGLLLASASSRIIQIWELRTGQVVKTLDNDGKTVQAITFSPGGSSLAVASFTTERLWNLVSGQRVRKIGDDEFQPWWARALAISPMAHVSRHYTVTESSR